MSANPRQPDPLNTNQINRLLNKTILINWTMVLVPVIILFLVIAFFYAEAYGLFVGGIVALAGSSVFIFMVVSSVQEKFIIKFRETVVQSVVQSTDKSIEYEPKSYFYLKELMYSGLLETAPNVYEADNYFLRKHPNYTMEVAWAYAFKQTSRERGVRVPRQATNNETVIHGLFYKFTLPHPFKTNVIVRRDKEKGLMQMFDENPSFLYNDFFHVVMEDSEFEKEFEVYARDSAEAKKLLKPLIDTMLHVKRHYKCKIQFSLIGNVVYVMVNSKRKYFSPGFILLKSSASVKKIQKDIDHVFYLPAQMDTVLSDMIHNR